MIQIITLVLACFASPVLSQILLSSPRSCLGSGSSVATSNLQLQLSQVYSQFDQGQTKPNEYAYGVDLATVPPIYNEQGSILTGTGDVLRVVMTGSTVDKSEGYSNDTNLVSTLVLESSILTFQVFHNSSALCSSIRTTTGDTGTITNGSAVVTESGCPYGGGEIALGFSIPLTDSYPLTTITTNLVALDPSNPALRLACYDLSFTPYYPDYFAYSLIRYGEIFLFALSPVSVLTKAHRFSPFDSRNRHHLPVPSTIRSSKILRILHFLAFRQRSSHRFFPHSQNHFGQRSFDEADVGSDLVQCMVRKADRDEWKFEEICYSRDSRVVCDDRLVHARWNCRCRMAGLRL